MGRKKKDAATFDVRLRFDLVFHQRIKRAADRDNNPVNAFIRTAVSEKLERLEKERGPF
jgi:predicted HicB family RNase H-like nuclease